jgi:hypothetical protein
MKNLNLAGSVIVMGLLSTFTNAALAAPPNTFSAGDAIIASKMNENFTDLDNQATTNSGDISLNTTAINANSGNITTNATAVSGNTASIGANSTATSANTANITTNTTSRIDHETRISSNASDIADNFSSITGNTANISTLENQLSNIETNINTEVAIDCGADPDAFIGTTITDSTTYTLTGMCNGPIWISKRRNVVIQGDETGIKDDGIILQTGLTENPFAALGIWESGVEVHNLTINAENYVSGVYGNDALSVGQLAIARIYDTDILGGDQGVGAYANAYVKTYDNVNVTGFNQTGIYADRNGSIELNGTIQVTTTLSPVDSSFSEGLAAWNGGHIEIRNGGTFTPGDSDDKAALSAGENGVIRIVDSGTSNINGDVSAGREGYIRIKGGAIIDGNIWTWQSGTMRLDNITHSGGEIQSWGNSFMRIESSTLNTTGFGFSVGRLSIMRVNDTAIISDSPLSASGFSIFNFRGTTDLGGQDITCHDPNQINIFGAVTNIGTISC